MGKDGSGHNQSDQVEHLLAVENFGVEQEQSITTEAKPFGPKAFARRETTHRHNGEILEGDAEGDGDKASLCIEHRSRFISPIESRGKISQRTLTWPFGYVTILSRK